MPMPMPYNASTYETRPVTARNTNSFMGSSTIANNSTNYAGIETSQSSSGSSISTNSSVSPAALSSLQSSPHLNVVNSSSYLLTTANPHFSSTSSTTTTTSSSNTTSITNTNNKPPSEAYDHPPSYITATNLKKSTKKTKAVIGMPQPTLASVTFTNASVCTNNHNNNNIMNETNALKDNTNNKHVTDGAFLHSNNNKTCKKFIENHYNNSVQSSDGNDHILFVTFVFCLFLFACLLR